MIQSVFHWDKDFFYAINGARNGIFDILMPVFSYTWLLWVMGILAFAAWGLAVYRGTKTWRSLKPVLFGIVLILGTAGVNETVTCVVKGEIGRLRPYQRLPFAYFQRDGVWQRNSETFTPWKHKADSFFSGHASHSMAVAVTVATLCPPLSPVIYAMPIVVGYSRIYLGKHYPSDVAAGWLIGASIALLARRLTRRIRDTLELRSGNGRDERGERNAG